MRILDSLALIAEQREKNSYQQADLKENEMNASDQIRKILTSIGLFGAIAATAQAGDARDFVALSGGSMLDRASIAKIGRGERQAVVIRNTPEATTHQSVELQYVADCTNATLNVVNWKLYSQTEARGEQVWKGGLDPKDRSFRHEPRTADQRELISQVCSGRVAAQ